MENERTPRAAIELRTHRPFTQPRDYAPNPIDMLRERLREEERPSYFAEVQQDWREIMSEVRGSPYSHALVAAAAIIGWTVVLVVPTLIGGGL